MRYEMKMPDLAATDSSMQIVRWLVSPGQTVRRGDPLAEVETDKAIMNVESVVSGVLVEVRFGPGESAVAGDVIAVIETT